MEKYERLICQGIVEMYFEKHIPIDINFIEYDCSKAMKNMYREHRDEVYKYVKKLLNNKIDKILVNDKH